MRQTVSFISRSDRNSAPGKRPVLTINRPYRSETEGNSCTHRLQDHDSNTQDQVSQLPSTGYWQLLHTLWHVPPGGHVPQLQLATAEWIPVLQSLRIRTRQHLSRQITDTLDRGGRSGRGIGTRWPDDRRTLGPSATKRPPTNACGTNSGIRKHSGR